MARKGYTTSPCHGCGSKQERKKDTLCADCLELMEQGKEWADAYNKAPGEEIEIPMSWYKPYDMTYRVNTWSKESEKIGEAMSDLARELSFRQPTRYYKYNNIRYGDKIVKDFGYHQNSAENRLFESSACRSGFDHRAKVKMLPEVAEILDRLDRAIRTVITEREKLAIEYGKNALLMLNSGQITMKDFEEG